MRKKLRLNRDELFSRIVHRLKMKDEGRTYKTKERYAYFTTSQLRIILEFIEKNIKETV